MRRFHFLCLVAIIAVLPYSQAAPAPKRTNAKPAVIDAGTEKNIQGVLENVMWDARVGVRQDEEVSKMDIIKKQKDWEAWLKKNLLVERVKDTNFVHVSFRDGSAKEQAAIINVVVDYYLKEDVKSRQELYQQIIDRAKRILGEEAAKSDEGVKRYEEKLRTLPKLVEHAKAP